MYFLLQAQKQVFNLMKFDSYPRFVKSDLFKMCLVEQIADHLPFGEQDTTISKSLQYPSKKVLYFVLFDKYIN